MLANDEADCRFCLGNELLVDEPLGGNRSFYMLGSVDPEMPHAVMIILRRHAVSPFDIHSSEWIDLGEMLTTAKNHLASFGPDGFTLGWNVGAVGGQHVFHVHLHVIARFADERNAGKGIRAVIRGCCNFPEKRSAFSVFLLFKLLDDPPIFCSVALPQIPVATEPGLPLRGLNLNHLSAPFRAGRFMEV